MQWHITHATEHHTFHAVVPTFQITYTVAVTACTCIVYRIHPLATFSVFDVTMINMSLLTATVPSQWKQARIRPVPKITSPQQAADYRPISITPVLSRIVERLVVRRYIYPVLSSPPPLLQFSDQFAFRPTGSTTAAIITLLHIVCNLLSSESYVIVISLDFSKAFDFVRRTPFPTPP